MSSEHWSTTPFTLQTIPEKPEGVPQDFYGCAVAMALIHNLFTRGLNSIYKHAPIVAERGSEQDKSDFINFALAWYEALHAHHTGEEKWYFPEIEQAAGNPGLMQANIDQHEVFRAPLDAFNDYFLSINEDPAALNSAHVLSLVDAFATPLFEHLKDEIPTLLEFGKKFPDVPIKQIDEDHAKKMLDTVSKLYFLPFFVSNFDREVDGGRWTSFMPGPPGWVLTATKYVFSFPYRGAWRFSACTFDMKLKPTMVQI
ncbi:hypothetical protein BKA62DRAFT_795245 [Auriculariales sp. MPI-PUGE-AT-0066]|nr:hypothetical protein BKA62DRAFT_795245 [Auriculariales sp. MPI-PUGE-AT-0066]